MARHRRNLVGVRIVRALGLGGASALTARIWSFEDDRGVLSCLISLHVHGRLFDLLVTRLDRFTPLDPGNPKSPPRYRPTGVSVRAPRSGDVAPRVSGAPELALGLADA